jgi:hypothetical protein
MRYLCSVFVVGVALAAPPRPLGIPLGGKVPDKAICAPAQTVGLKYCTSVPKPVSGADKYYLVVTRDNRVAKVAAILSAVDNTGNLQPTKELYQRLLDAISAAWGAPTKTYSFYVGGALFDGPGEERLALQREELRWMAVWREGPHSALIVLDWFDGGPAVRLEFEDEPLMAAVVKEARSKESDAMR